MWAGYARQLRYNRTIETWLGGEPVRRLHTDTVVRGRQQGRQAAASWRSAAALRTVRTSEWSTRDDDN